MGRSKQGNKNNQGSSSSNKSRKQPPSIAPTPKRDDVSKTPKKGVGAPQATSNEDDTDTLSLKTPAKGSESTDGSDSCSKVSIGSNRTPKPTPPDVTRSNFAKLRTNLEVSDDLPMTVAGHAEDSPGGRSSLTHTKEGTEGPDESESIDEFSLNQDQSILSRGVNP